MSTDIKLSKVQLTKMDRFLGNMMGNLDKKALIDLIVPKFVFC